MPDPTLPTTLAALILWTLQGITSSTLFFLAAIALAAITYLFFFRVPQISRVADEIAFGMFASVFVISYVMMVVVFYFYDDTSNIPQAPSFMWAIAWSFAITLSALLGVVFSALVVIQGLELVGFGAGDAGDAKIKSKC